MPPRCKAPKCAEVKNKCACPNPWVEFLAKNAHKGKISMAQHSAAYKALKDSGAFVLKPGLNNGPCKSDPVKLCAWKLRRKAGHKDLVASVARRGAVRNERILRRLASDKNGGPSKQDFLWTVKDYMIAASGLDSKDEFKDLLNAKDIDPAELVDKWSNEFDLKSKGLKVGRLIGYGDYGAVFEGTLKTSSGVKSVVIKILMSSEENNDWLSREVYIHRMMYKALPHRVPKLIKAFKLKGYVSDEWGRKDKPSTHYPHLLVMEKISYDLEHLTKKYGKDTKVMTRMVRDLKKLLQELTAAKLVHGDFAFRNIGYKMISDRPKLFMIDFSESWKTTFDCLLIDTGTILDDLRYTDGIVGIDDILRATAFPVIPEDHDYKEDAVEKDWRAFRKSMKLPKIPF